ncbi:MAG: acylphosphatase [Candidatus Paceibacterota bacterium]
MMEIQCVVHGTVQNVAYRAYVQDSATELGVCGWVKNESDGTVSVCAQGERDILKDFIEYLHEGSLKAKVTGVSVDWGTVGNVYEDFAVLYV